MHEITIVPAQKMDASGLTQAVCSCDKYQSGVGTERQSRKAGNHHATTKNEQEARRHHG